MELIDRKALKKTIPATRADIFENCRNCKLLDDFTVIELIDNAPTIDAKPVVHGHWDDASLISSGYLLRNSENIVEHRCSVCKKWSSRLELVSEDLFCPNCGAKMDGVNYGR